MTRYVFNRLCCFDGEAIAIGMLAGGCNVKPGCSRSNACSVLYWLSPCNHNRNCSPPESVQRLTTSQPYAFQSREYVRKNVLNHSVRFKTLYTIPASQREYGLVVLNDGSNLAEKLLNEGLVKVREEAGRKDDTEEIAEIIGRYKVFEEAAKEAKIGLFGGDSGAIRCENDYPADAAAFLEKWKGKRLEGMYSVFCLHSRRCSGSVHELERCC